MTKVIKKKKKVIDGIANIRATFNNFIINITDTHGNTIALTSSGAHGFKGAKKSTPFAGSLAAGAAAKNAIENGMKTVQVVMRGAGISVGSSKEGVIKAIESAGLSIISIQDDTPIPHNGCRLKGKRRV